MFHIYCEKKCIDIFCPSLTKLVNFSLQNGIFLNPFKQAIVTPLRKKLRLPIQDLKNYQPVSDLSCLSKVVERIVSAQIRFHMETLFSQPVRWDTQQKLPCVSKMRFIYLCPRACLQHWCCLTCPLSFILSTMTHSFPVSQLGLALLVLF